MGRFYSFLKFDGKSTPKRLYEQSCTCAYLCAYGNFPNNKWTEGLIIRQIQQSQFSNLVYIHPSFCTRLTTWITNFIYIYIPAVGIKNRVESVSQVRLFHRNSDQYLKYMFKKEVNYVTKNKKLIIRTVPILRWTRFC